MVPVEPPHLRPMIGLEPRIAAIEAASGRADHAVDHIAHERGLDPSPADAFDPRACCSIRRPAVARFDRNRKNTEFSGSTTQSRVAAEALADSECSARSSTTGAARAGSHHNPGGVRVSLFEAHLREQAFGNVIVAAPIGRPLGKSKLIHEVAAGFLRDLARLLVDLRRLGQAHLAAEKFDRLALRLGGSSRSDCDEGQTEQASEIGLRDRRRAGRGFHHRLAAPDPAVAEAIEKERTRQTMLEAAGRVGRLVLEIKVDAGRGEARQIDPDEMRVGGAVEVSFDQAHGVRDPIAVDRRSAAVDRFSRPRARNQLATGGRSPRPLSAPGAQFTPSRMA